MNASEARTIEAYRTRSLRSNSPWFRCVSEDQLAFAREMGLPPMSPIITVQEAFLELRYHISTAKHLPPTKAGTLQGARQRHLETSEVLRKLALE